VHIAPVAATQRKLRASCADGLYEFVKRLRRLGDLAFAWLADDRLRLLQCNKVMQADVDLPSVWAARHAK
jgi:hypothetical protein